MVGGVEASFLWRLFGAAPIGVVIGTAEGRVLLANPLFSSLLGYAQEELQGMTVRQLTHPEDVHESERAVGELSQNGQGSVRLSKRYVTKSGDVLWAETTLLQVRPNDGQPAYNVALIENVTPFKQMARHLEHLASFVHHNPGPVVQLNQEGIVLTANPAAKSLLGNGCTTKLRWNSVWPDMTPEEWTRILKSEEPVQRESWLSGHCYLFTFVSLANGTGVHAYGSRITDLKQAQEALRVAEKQFHQAQKMEVLGRMAGGVAHDFNNLLTVILGSSASVLNHLGPDSELREELEEIRKAGQRATELVKRMLIFSRQEMAQPRVTDINPLLNDLNKFLYRIVGEDVERVVISEADPTWVRIDPSQLEQVLMNLVVNARDAMPKGGRLEIGIKKGVIPSSDSLPQIAKADSRAWACLSVSDTGVGMTDEVKTHLFEPFFTTKEPGKGTGLGLAMVYGVVTLYGGTIRVKSRSGEGTTIQIYLPLAPAEALPAKPKQVSGAAPTGHECILVVEDEPMVRRFMSMLLRGLGYQVLESDHGQEALVRIGEEKGRRIRLVVSDVMMPFLSGIELRNELKKVRPELPVLFVSGYTDKTAMLGSMADHDAFLQKPFEMHEFAQVVRQLLDATTGKAPSPV